MRVVLVKCVNNVNKGTSLIIENAPNVIAISLKALKTIGTLKKHLRTGRMDR